VVSTIPEGRADLIVCNPPWLPARPTSPIEQGVYDTDGTVLRGFLTGLSAHLRPAGEGWLILSDLAEHLGLRTRPQLLDAIRAAHLRAEDKSDDGPGAAAYEEVLANQPTPAALRRLDDGSQYRIVKVFHDAETLTGDLTALGWSAHIRTKAGNFIGIAEPPTIPG
jgi:methylase of polypeptide subunit release factors